MGRRTQLIRIPLEQGVRTYADPYTIGPQPRLLQNMGLREHQQIGGLIWTNVDVLNAAAAATYTLTDVGTPTAGVNTNGYLTGVIAARFAADTVPRLYALGTYTNSVTGTTHFGAWDVVEDIALHAFGTTTVINTPKTTQPALAAFWPSQSAIYAGQSQAITEPVAATTLSKITITDWSPSVVGAFATWTTPGAGIRPTALIQYLDRLFLSKAADTTIYTDPFDDTTIRATSSITAPGLGEVTAYARPTVGDIDASVAAHLLIFGQDSLWVFDGDPQFGNASLRQLSATVGCASQTHIAETPHGAIFLGSDGRFHLVPPGATQMDPPPWPEVADRVRDLIPTTFWQTALKSARPATVAWFEDRFYWFPGSKNGHLELDFRDPTAPFWTGPHSSRADDIMGAVRVPATVTEGAASLFASGFNTMGVSGLSNVATARTQQLRTGFLWTPGYDLVVRRVLLTSFRHLTATEITVTLYRDDGTSIALPTITPALTTSVRNEHKVTTTTFAPVGGAVRAPAVYLEMLGPATRDLQVIRVEVEVETVERRQ